MNSRLPMMKRLWQNSSSYLLWVQKLELEEWMEMTRSYNDIWASVNNVFHRAGGEKRGEIFDDKS